ncbi:MAG: tetraacyldisaccharide 4'-kinase [Lysobacteraceae bacterium]
MPAVDIWSTSTPPWHLRLLSRLFGTVAATRRWLYRRGWLKSVRVPAPVIVVGNLTAGGSGKTPLVMALVERLRERGFRPGVISRGYGRRTKGLYVADADSDAAEVGDEPLLIARQCDVPVAVAEWRADAATALLSRRDCDILIADDGLQHYGLARDIEIAVVDGQRGFGNGWLLPAGPLREPLSRLQRCDFVVVNGESSLELPTSTPVATLRMTLKQPRALRGGKIRDWSAFVDNPVHAVAGIGNPERFFTQLEARGLSIHRHPFADHQAFSVDDLRFAERGPLLMTAKDAVKCRDIAPADSWVVDAETSLPDDFLNALYARLDALSSRREDNG